MGDLVLLEGGKRDWSVVPFAFRMTELYGRLAYVRKGGKNEALNYEFMQESEIKRKLNAACRDLYIVVMKTEVIPVGVPNGKEATVIVRITLADGIALAAEHVQQAQCVVLEGIGSGMDRTDKGPMKAVVSAFKYAIANGCMVQTGDDPEADPESDRAVLDDLLELIRTAPGSNELTYLKPRIAEWRKNKAAFAQLKAACVNRMKELKGSPTDGGDAA